MSTIDEFLKEAERWIGALSEFKTGNATAVNPVGPNPYDMNPEIDDVNPEDPEIDVKPEDSASQVEPGKKSS